MAEQATLHGPRFEVDASLQIVAWPEETARRTRIAAEEAIGKRCWQIIHPGSLSIPAGCARSCLAIPRARAPTLQLKRRSEDEPCAAMPLPSSKGGAIIWMAAREMPMVVVEDPMERVLVRGCMSESLGDVRQTLDFLRRYTAADDCELFLVDERREAVLHTGCTGLDTQALLELTRIPLGEGYPGSVTARQRPMLTNDFQNDRVFLRASVRRCGLRSFLGVPLARDGEPLGYLGLGWRTARVPIMPLLTRLEGLKPLLLAGLPRTRPAVAPRASLGAALCIRALGGLSLWSHGELLSAQAFTRKKAVALLKLLLLRAPAAVHRDLLIDQLWPDADSQRGGNRLHGVVHALRAALDHGGASDCIGHEQDAYFFRPTPAVFVDLFEFQRLLQQARNLDGRLGEAEVQAALERAVELYEGDLFADDPYTGWLDAPRQQLRDAYLRAARELTTRYARSQRHEDALRVLRQATLIDPLAEDLQRRLIRTLLALDRATDAREHYERLVALIRREVDAEPLNETLALGMELRRIAGHRALKCAP